MQESNLLPDDVAPDFTLNSVYDGKVEKFTLSSLKGKPILISFYPVDFGYVSPSEFYQLHSLMDKFKTLGCELLAISTEHTPSMIKYLNADRNIAGLGGDMNIRLVSDPVGDAAKSYGVFKQEENVSFKAVILIDCNFRIVSCEKFDFPVGCNFDEILFKLQGCLAEENKNVPECSTCEITGHRHGPN